MSQDSAAETELKTPSKWPKRLLILFFVLLPFGIFLQFYMYFHWAGRAELRRAMEEADQLDPDWRLDDLLAKRKKLPDEENAALIVMRVTGLERPGTSMIPAGWGSDPILATVDGDTLLPAIQLNQEQADAVRNELAKVGPALVEIYKVENMPQGQYPLAFRTMSLRYCCPIFRRIGKASTCFAITRYGWPTKISQMKL